VTVKWNYCASFYIAVTVIQIVSVTEGTALTEQVSIFFIAVYGVLFHDRKLSFLVV